MDLPRKRLLVVTSTFPRWSGDTTPSFIYELCIRLSRKYDVSVLAPHAMDTQAHENMNGIEVFRFRYAPASIERLAYGAGILANLRRNPLYLALVPLFLLALWRALRKLLKHENFDTVHAHWLIPQGWIASLLLCGQRKPRFICTVHGSDLNALRGMIFHHMQRRVFRCAEAITVVSQSLADQAIHLGIKPARVSVIPMGVDTKDRFLPSKSTNDNTILFVGRLAKEKGAEVLIQAMPHIMQHHPDVELLIIGDGPLRSSLEALAKELGVASRLRFVGAIPNQELPRYYQEAALVALPSLNEGFGLAAAEAFACARPVVASNIPSLLNFIQEGINGMLFPTGDAKALAEKIAWLLANPSVRDSMGQAGRALVAEHFEWDTITARYAEILFPPSTV